MSDRDIINIISQAMTDADIAWSERSAEERANKRPSDVKASAVLRALRKAGVIAEARP